MSLKELEVYDIPFTDMEKTMLGWVEEALDLRHGDAGDPQGKLDLASMDQGFQSVESMLLRTRLRSDRVDQLLANITRARGRVRRAQEQAKFEAELAFSTAAVNNAAHRINYASREERKADADLASIEERRLAHQAERIVSIASECWEVINQVHWQLSSIRDDLRTQLRSMQFESNLER